MPSKRIFSCTPVLAALLAVVGVPGAAGASPPSEGLIPQGTCCFYVTITVTGFFDALHQHTGIDGTGDKEESIREWQWRVRAVEGLPFNSDVLTSSLGFESKDRQEFKVLHFPVDVAAEYNEAYVALDPRVIPSACGPSASPSDQDFELGRVLGSKSATARASDQRWLRLKPDSSSPVGGELEFQGKELVSPGGPLGPSFFFGPQCHQPTDLVALNVPVPHPDGFELPIGGKAAVLKASRKSFSGNCQISASKGLDSRGQGGETVEVATTYNQVRVSITRLSSRKAVREKADALRAIAGTKLTDTSNPGYAAYVSGNAASLGKTTC